MAQTTHKSKGRLHHEDTKFGVLFSQTFVPFVRFVVGLSEA